MPLEIAPDRLDLARFVRPGDTILWSQGTAEPLTLTEALAAQRGALGGVRAFLGASFSTTFGPEHGDAIAFSGWAGIGTNRRLAAAGLLDIVPCHFSEIPGLIADGRIAVDIVLVQLSEDGDGRFSTGVVNDYLRAAIARARVVIGEVNERTPWTFAEEPLRRDDVDVVVRTARPMLEVSPQPIGALEERIGRLVADLVPEGAVLQVGIGAIPDAALAALSGHRRLGVHSGLIGDSVVDLIECGAVTNELKPIDRGVSVTGLAFGTRRLYGFVDRNPRVRFDPPTRTHAAAILGRFERFVSLNSAIAVDLSGQVNAETADGVYVGAIGGQVDFARAAARSPGGRSVIAFPSTAAGGRISRIVARLPDGVVTTARSDVDAIVTEHGIAHLRGATLSERARRLIAIAHPDHREALSRAARGDS